MGLLLSHLLIGNAYLPVKARISGASSGMVIKLTLRFYRSQNGWCSSPSTNLKRMGLNFRVWIVNLVRLLWLTGNDSKDRGLLSLRIIWHLLAHMVWGGGVKVDVVIVNNGCWPTSCWL